MRESGEKIGRELATAHRPDTKTTENPSASPILQQPMPGGKPGVVCWRRRSILETPMTANLMTYKDDAGDRIVAALRAHKARAQKRLAPAARLAGEQLEWPMPVAFGTSPAGMFGGKYTSVPPGTILFVLADERGVATIQMPEQVG